MIDQLIQQYNELFGTLITNGIQQSKGELEKVIEYLGDRKFSNMAEGGVSDGGSMWFYSNLFLKEGGKFTAIDPRIRPVVPVMAKWLEENKNVKVDVIDKMSTDTDLKDLDFVHIDGEHSYESVKADFWHFYPRVVDGGVILLHDTLGWDGVIRFRKELDAQFDTHTFGSPGVITTKRRIRWKISKMPANYSSGITLVQKWMT